MYDANYLKKPHGSIRVVIIVVRNSHQPHPEVFP
jgi:hypothetical protein